MVRNLCERNFAIFWQFREKKSKTFHFSHSQKYILWKFSNIVPCDRIDSGTKTLSKIQKSTFKLFLRPEHKYLVFYTKLNLSYIQKEVYINLLRSICKLLRSICELFRWICELFRWIGNGFRWICEGVRWTDKSFRWICKSFS